MKTKRMRSLMSACFLLCGIASFASLPWIERRQIQSFLLDEPYYAPPVPMYANRILIRNDDFGKGRFGATRGKNGKRKHLGLDLLTAVSNPITASKSGRVSVAGIDRGYGWYVEIHHPDGKLSRYAHLTRILVSQGDWVAVGQKIGLCGKSGNADEPRILPHLHFEIREGNLPLDPLSLFDPKLIAS